MVHAQEKANAKKKTKQDDTTNSFGLSCKTTACRAEIEVRMSLPHGAA
jgi:hypothetical protein